MCSITDVFTLFLFWEKAVCKEKDGACDEELFVHQFTISETCLYMGYHLFLRLFPLETVSLLLHTMHHSERSFCLNVALTGSPCFVIKLHSGWSPPSPVLRSLPSPGCWSPPHVFCVPCFMPEVLTSSLILPSLSPVLPATAEEAHLLITSLLIIGSTSSRTLSYWLFF